MCCIQTIKTSYEANVVDYPLLNYNPDKEDIIVSKHGVGDLIDRGKDTKGTGLKWLMAL